MTKIFLVFSLLFNLLFSFTCDNRTNEEVKLLNSVAEDCNEYDSIVNITTQNNLISVSGVIVTSSNGYIYVATSFVNYDKNYNYEIIFSDYSRKKANVVGFAKDDGILLLKVETGETYCSLNYSRSKLIDKGEEVNLIGAYDYNKAYAIGTIDEIGVCSNCDEETFKNYFYSRISVELENYFLGAGVFDKRGQFLGLVVDKLERYHSAIKMLDVDKLVMITINLINNGKYEKNYIKYNLLNVNSLTKHEKYLYSLDEELTEGVLVSSIHYLNYFIGGLNQGMVIYEVENIRVSNCYEFDSIISRYKKGSELEIRVRKPNGKMKVYQIKV